MSRESLAGMLSQLELINPCAIIGFLVQTIMGGSGGGMGGRISGITGGGSIGSGAGGIGSILSGIGDQIWYKRSRTDQTIYSARS